MTLRTSAPHAKRRWAGLAGTVAIAMMLLVGGALAASGTGASVVDYAQCANGKPGTTPSDDCNKGMIFGILNANNSQYAEDQVTAQRLILSLPAGGSVNGRTIQLKWLVRKAGNHAYDSLATWDYTINGTVANACLGLSGPVKNTCITDFNAGGPASEPIDLDGAVVTPDTNGGGGVTSNHQLTGQNVEMFGLGAGGDIDDFSYTGDLVDESGDLYRTATITYHVDSLANARQVMLLFGGHLAAGGTIATGSPRGWGDGNGAADINGGPYHIKLIQVDGAAIGNRDNQIMSSAILPLSPSSIATVPSGTPTTSWSAVLDDKATVTGASPTGTVTFNLYGDGAGVCTTAIFSTTVNLTAVSGSTTQAEAFASGTPVGSATGTRTVTTAGTYEWTASYSGDANNVAAPVSTCGDETLLVTAATNASVSVAP
jgi:hypothetical protein